MLLSNGLLTKHCPISARHQCVKGKVTLDSVTKLKSKEKTSVHLFYFVKLKIVNAKSN